MKLIGRASGAILFSLVCSAFAVLSMTVGYTYNWPDYLHVTYGFPLTWGTHTLDTIAGPVDKWQVSIVGLSGDLLFWFGSLVLGNSLIVLLRRTKT